jgi:site-specific DNA-methyltransferase (cytosine-N4-specific)
VLESYYETRLGKAYLGDALAVTRRLRGESVNLIVTSPPFPLTFRKKKPYGSVKIDEYVTWFFPIADQLKRVLKPDGSLVIDIGGVWNKGEPTRNLYQYHLLLTLCEKVGFHFAQDFYWYNPGALPAPAEWVNVRRIRVKSAVNLVWWLSKTPWPKADNRSVLRDYSDDMLRLFQRGYRVKTRPSGHNITAKFTKNHGGAIPPNLIEIGNNDSNGEYLQKCLKAGLPVHPARFPRGLPEFFIKLCTDRGDIVLDPFAGSNVTGEAAERLGRRWIAVELVEEYLRGSKLRFEGPPLLALMEARGTKRRNARVSGIEELSQALS